MVIRPTVVAKHCYQAIPQHLTQCQLAKYQAIEKTNEPNFHQY